MPVVIVATPAAVNANSYLTLAEANAYHDTHLYASDWTDADDDDQRSVALIMATRLMDSIYEWVCWPTTQTQALQWPRTGVLDALRRNYVDNYAIPPQLKNATAELARTLIKENRTLDYEVEAKGITSLTAGPVSLAFKDSVRAKVLTDSVVQLLPPWWGRQRFRSNVVDLLRA